MLNNKKTKNNKIKNNKIKNNKQMKLLITTGLAIIVVSGIVFINNGKGNKQGVNNQLGTIEAQLSESGDLIIPVEGITDKASFYGYEVDDGTKLEVLAIKASDDSIRTAFNTCQVCYSSGKGYYVQEGDILVCQNCGNRFKASDVEVTKGGCNPVPILSENKTVDETNITISKDYLEKAKVIFENWKS